MAEIAERTARGRGVAYSQAVVIVAVALIFAGFAHTVGEVLLHPPTPAPPILWAHVTLAVAWLACLLVQSGLAARGRIDLHRRVAPVAIAVGVAMSGVAFVTAVELRRIAVAADPIPGEVAYLAVPLAAWLTFTVPFALALVWRRRPRRHRALMIVAACMVVGPALGRFPEIRHAGLYWAGLIPNLMILSVMLHDRWRTGVWNGAYAVALPLLIATEGVMVFLQIAEPPAWLAASRWLMSVI